MEALLDPPGRHRVTWQLLLLLLLLTYLLVANGAVPGDCDRPEGRETFVLSNEGLLLNSFSNGIVVELSCANGFVKESGSGTTACINGTWSEPDIICKKKDCGPPKPEPNMIFDTSQGTLFGTTVFVSCEKGFQISGTSYKTCLASGWKGRSTCKLMKCSEPAAIPNGRHTWVSPNRPQYGDTISYICNEGYVLVGNNITCTETGSYNSAPPDCQIAPTKQVLKTSPVPSTTPSPTTVAPTKQVLKTSPVPSTTPSPTTVAPTKQVLKTSPVPSTTPSPTTVAPTKQVLKTSPVPSTTPSPTTVWMIYILPAFGALAVLAVVVFLIFINKQRTEGSYNLEEGKPENSHLTKHDGQRSSGSQSQSNFSSNCNSDPSTSLVQNHNHEKTF